MTTEQMDWLDDERARRNQKRLPEEVEHTLTVDTGWPIPARTLQALTATCPADAAVFVTVKQGGSERDPYPVGARIVAKWRGR